MLINQKSYQHLWITLYAIIHNFFLFAISSVCLLKKLSTFVDNFFCFVDTLCIFYVFFFFFTFFSNIRFFRFESHFLYDIINNRTSFLENVLILKEKIMNSFAVLWESTLKKLESYYELQHNAIAFNTSGGILTITLLLILFDLIGPLSFNFCNHIAAS